MKLMRALRFVAMGLALAYAVPVACGSGGVVGGECKPGLTNCGPNAQGADGTGARAGNANAGGTDSGDGGSNGAAAASQGGDGELPDGGFFDSPVDGQPDGEAPIECLPPHDDPSHCGDCDTRCVDPTPLCAPDGEGSFECVPVCDPPLVECQGQCVDPESFNSDPDNCGRCGRECPSDICQEGECIGARYGHIALLCMDFGSNMASSTPTTLLGNAVFLPAQNPVKVLAYTNGASAAAVTRTNTVIGWAGDTRRREADITEARTVEAVTRDLNINDFQVLLIHDLDRAEPGDPEAAAVTWESSNVLTSFSKAGGVVIVLDGADGTGEMHQLINAGRLLDPTGQTSVLGHTDITGSEVYNHAAADILSANTTNTFAGTSHTCTFDTDAQPDAETIFIYTDDVREGQGAPVAIHRVVAP
jgi:hypothetical protein